MKITDDNMMNGLAEDAKKSQKTTKDIYLAKEDITEIMKESM